MLEFVIFASGALIMVLEMVGARVMAPHLGTSVIVWTSLIGVVLACLALGAFLGGRLADKKLSTSMLARILSGAGLGSALTALGHRFVGMSVSTGIDNIYMAAVVAAICLFAIPALAFGMVSPYIIRLRLADISTSGATVGRLYALSTTGSILGTFLGGFVLISYFSSTHILLGTAAAMLLLSLLVGLRGKKSRSQSASTMLLLLCVPAIAFINAEVEYTMYTKGTPPPVETPYNSIRISQGNNEKGRPVRLMATDPGYAQSGTYLDNPSELLFDYTKYYALGTVLFPETKKVLMLGGGGYSIPKWLLAGHGGLDSQSLRLDVVELDAGMTQLAKEAFGLPEDARMRIFHEDARRHLTTNTEKYQLVFVDVFNSHYSVPFHMGTVEAGAALRQAVTHDGAVLMNIISAFEGPDSYILQSIYGALQQNFEQVYIFAVDPQQPLGEVQNLMALALPKANTQLQEILEQSEKHTQYSQAIQNILASRIQKPVPQTVPPLRDDFAPVERYAQALLKK